MRRFLPWLSGMTLALCLAAGCRVHPAAAQGIDGPQTVYQSAEFGYLFWWNTDEWAVEEQSAEPGADWVSITNGDMAFSVYGFTAPGITPEACLDDSLAQMANTPGVTRVENLEELGTAPAVTTWTDPSGAAGARVDYFVAYTSDTGKSAFVFEDSCYQMGASDALIWTSVRQTAAVFNAGNDLQPLPSRTLILPRWTWTAATYEYFGLGVRGQATSALIPFADGSERGVVTSVTFSSCVGPSTLVVIGEGLGAGNFVLSPAALSLTDGTRPTEVTWLSPPFAPADSAAMAHGDTAVLRLHFPDGGEVQFTDADGAAYPLGGTGGCGGGGSMPIRVPLE